MMERVTVDDSFTVEINGDKYPATEVLSVLNYGYRKRNDLFCRLCSAREDISELYSIWDSALISDLASRLFCGQFPKTCFIPERPGNQLSKEYENILVRQKLFAALNIIARFGKVPPGDKPRFTHEDHIRNIMKLIERIKCWTLDKEFG